MGSEKRSRKKGDTPKIFIVEKCEQSLWCGGCVLMGEEGLAHSVITVYFSLFPNSKSSF